MKKLFTSFVVASTVAACGSGAKTDTTDKTTTDKTTTDKTTTDKTTTDKTTAVVKGKAQQGTFKVGVYGTDLGTTLKGKELTEVIAKYTQDIKLPGGTDAQIQAANGDLDGTVTWAGTGSEYLKLPSQLSLVTSFADYMVQEGGAEGYEQLSDKTNLADENLDALFIQVEDEKTNSSAVYKTVVEKKEFGATKLFFIGEDSESQDGSSSKKFAGENVSTASFNEYAAAYIAGFQAAVGAIKYNSSEDQYEESTISFLIGALEESEDRKKAFAFRRGVEAASKHADYSKYLKVKFVKKTEDESSSKKLYRSVSDWKEIDDNKRKLYEFAGSDTFRDDVDRSIVYIAGTTAKQWRGSISTARYNADGADGDKNKFKSGDDFGLVGALYNYDKTGATERSYSKGVWVVLDKAPAAKTAANDGALVSGDNTLSQVLVQNKGQVDLERHQVVYYGALGAEAAGTETYAENALKGLYMGGPNYMIGKHTIFGAGLDISFVQIDPWTEYDSRVDRHRITPWLFKAKKDGDTASKVKERFDNSLVKAWEKELTEAEITKTSPWLK